MRSQEGPVGCQEESGRLGGARSQEEPSGAKRSVKAVRRSQEDPLGAPRSC